MTPTNQPSLTKEEIHQIQGRDIQYSQSFMHSDACVTAIVDRHRLLAALAESAAEVERLKAERIDPRAIYDTFDCPCCKGSKTVAPFAPDSGKCVEEKCEFCDGDGFVAFAHLADRHSRLTREMAEAKAELAALRATGDDDSRARACWESHTRSCGGLSCDWNTLDEATKQFWRDAASAVAAPLVAQIAEKDKRIAELEVAMGFANATREQADHEIEVLQRQASSADQRASAPSVRGTETGMEVTQGKGECPECHYTAWVISAETGKVLHCKVCDEMAQKRDALQMEREYKAEADTLRTRLAEVERAGEPIVPFMKVYAQSAWPDATDISVGSTGVKFTCGQARAFVAAFLKSPTPPAAEPDAHSSEANKMVAGKFAVKWIENGGEHTQYGFATEHESRYWARQKYQGWSAWSVIEIKAAPAAEAKGDVTITILDRWQAGLAKLQQGDGR